MGRRYLWMDLLNEEKIPVQQVEPTISKVIPAQLSNYGN